ncbi:arginine--tRNA ligase [Blattabacterium cuenoti]|uniref:arginine--tRNA ligase n=1 Tax=Blattabacterium cuenoti TaxID=1653831 RepID=UPI00163B8C96|nr:arginine--tRNA ligase [Blattabacterium cuenoti]
MNNHLKYDVKTVEKSVKNAVFYLYKININLNFQYTKNNNLGDISLILFSLSKQLNKSINELGNNIGYYVQNELKGFVKFSIYKGFLNFTYYNKYYIFLIIKMSSINFSDIKDFFSFKKKKIMVEYSSPNANKPLHLGHLRNILIGSSISNILKIVGHKVIQIQIINDRGIHICKSLLSWKKFGNDNTPKKSNIKGDHFVGKYYSLFDKIYNDEIKIFKNNETPILKKARNLLKKWEKGDKLIIDIWKKMNSWVYDGFKNTYNDLGINFDKTEYESQIYKFGKDIIIKGLKKGIFFKKSDGSIWINLKKDGYESKLLLRSDQTSVYITQDIGNAIKRFKENNIDEMVYIVGKEQESHFCNLFKILKRLKYTWVKKIFHLSYEMVFLPSGKMKSREGNIVDIDSLISKMENTAKYIFYKKKDKKINKSFNYSYKEIGLCALKYYFIQIDPKKKIIFDPVKSIDFKGKTGVYIQYTYSRIRSLEKKFFNLCVIDNFYFDNITLNIYEKNMIKILYKYLIILNSSANKMNPSLIANYVYDVSKTFNHLYQKKRLINTMNIISSNFCMHFIHITGNVIKSAMNLLGIKMVDQI